MADFITFGETMIRLSTPGHERMEMAQTLDLHPGGAESNVATALARLGKQVAWLSRLPDNDLGRLVAGRLRAQGVDLAGVRWATGERMGLYFVEFGQPPRPTRVFYDRADSAFSHMTPVDLALPMVRAAKWLHLTGITFGLTGRCVETAHALLDEARRAGLTISFDVNYRAALWSPQKAGESLAPVCAQSDILIMALRDAVGLFGMPTHLQDAARQLYDQFQVEGRAKTVIVTNGAAGAVGIDGGGLVDCEAYPVPIMERLGAGDSFTAGVICRLSEGAALVEALRFGAALAALKLTIPGDVALITRGEVEMLMKSGESALLR